MADAAANFEDLRDRGLAAVAADEFQAARQLLSAATRLKPDDAYVLFNLGFAEHRLGKPQTALVYYTAAIECTGTYYDAYYMRGVAHDELRNFALALSDFQRAVELCSDDADAHNSLGIAYRHSGNLKKALREYDKSIRLEPTVARYYFNRGLAYEDLRDYERAIADYERLSSTTPVTGNLPTHLAA